MTSYRYLGSATTDANGIAKYNFTGSGAGEIDFIASLDNPIVDGSIVSVPCNVLDATFFDKGESATGEHNDNWVFSAGTLAQNFTREELYTVFKEPSSTNIIARPNVSLEGEYVLELDIKIVDGSYNQSIIDIRNTITGSKLNGLTGSNAGINDRDWHHIKVEAKTDKYYAYLDGSTTVAYSEDNHYETPYRFGLWTGGDITELHFKNVKVYPI